MPAPLFNFDGLNNYDNYHFLEIRYLPPDTNGDVGLDHYVQWVNAIFRVWKLDRNTHTATPLGDPKPGNIIWTALGSSPCYIYNRGDPIILYDHLADRWIASQFAFARDASGFPVGPFYQCIAVSQTGDPTGAWYAYMYMVSIDKLNDYAKLAVWPDAYYMTINQFKYPGGTWAGAGVVAFERERMLTGWPSPRMVYIDLENANPDFGGMLPADLDGMPPPPGAPGYFMEVDDASWLGDPSDTMRIWEFRPNWNDPDGATFGLGGQPNVKLAVADFTPICIGQRSCVPQPPPDTYKLDAIGDRLMHRLQYRYFGGHETFVTNHTVSVNDEGGNRSGVRWYEVRKSDKTWTIHQQGTYAGDSPNAEYRWMGSAAMDGVGNLAIGYSVSSTTIFPSIYYTGRGVIDPLNTLGRGEQALIDGTGAQTGTSSRWGDYTMLAVDPTDDCTFWYTNEYYDTHGINWLTRIGSFVFTECLAATRGTLAGTVYDADLDIPLKGAWVQAGAYLTQSDNNGNYEFQYIPSGAYTVTASGSFYWPASVPGVQVNAGGVTLQDLAIARKPVNFFPAIVR
jgi:hypothetical protein